MNANVDGLMNKETNQSINKNKTEQKNEQMKE